MKKAAQQDFRTAVFIIAILLLLTAWGNATAMLAFATAGILLAVFRLTRQTSTQPQAGMAWIGICLGAAAAVLLIYLSK